MVVLLVRVEGGFVLGGRGAGGVERAGISRGGGQGVWRNGGEWRSGDSSEQQQQQQYADAEMADAHNDQSEVEGFGCCGGEGWGGVEMWWGLGAQELGGLK
jgi:hypothetical protein